MKQTIIFFIGLFSVIIISLMGCGKVTKEESPETIAANLLKQGTAEPELLLGEWALIKFAYTSDGNKISDRNTITYNVQPITHPTLIIPFAPTPIENSVSERWCLNYINSTWYICSLTNHLIKLEGCGSTYIHAPVEREITYAFGKSYSFVIKGNQLIIYFKGGDNKNLLILEKRYYTKENPEVIAANLLKQGTADPKLLPGVWRLFNFGYTFNGNEIFEGSGFLGGMPEEECPHLVIPDDITSDWYLNFYNHYRGNCSLSGNLISFSSFTSITGMEPQPKEKEVAAAIRNAYSFVISGNDLTIHYIDEGKNNLLFLTKNY